MPLPPSLTRAMKRSNGREYVVFSVNAVTALSVTSCAAATFAIKNAGMPKNTSFIYDPHQKRRPAADVASLLWTSLQKVERPRHVQRRGSCGQNCKRSYMIGLGQ